LTGGTVTGETRIIGALSASSVYTSSITYSDNAIAIDDVDIDITSNSGAIFLNSANGINIADDSGPRLLLQPSNKIIAETLIGSEDIILQDSSVGNLISPITGGSQIIIGARNSKINSGVVNSVILGGLNITASTSNTAYAYNLNISSALTSYNGVSGSGLIGKILSGTSAGFSLVNVSDISNFYPSTGGTVQGGVVANYLSATTISGGTLYSGSTNLSDIFVTQATVLTTYVQPGANILTAGTSNFPVVSTVASPVFNNISFSGQATGSALSATTISGGTIYSGSTDLYNIFQQIGVVDGVQTIGQGTNIQTGGTATNPMISVVSSPDFNNISFSGQAIGIALSATTISGGTIYSGSTNLEQLFHQKNGYLLQKAGSVSGSTFAGNPKKSTVLFTNYFPDNNYAISITATVNRTWTIESKTLSGFTINANANPSFSSDEVYWIANEIGEGYR
jgi:hypothetical protein